MPNHKRTPGRQASAEPAVVQEPQPESDQQAADRKKAASTDASTVGRRAAAA